MRIGDWSSDVCSSDLADRTDARDPQMVSRRLKIFRSSGGADGLSRRAHACKGPAPRYGKGHDGADDMAGPGARRPPARRSEEHTSELQSLMRISYAVFCLKKKNTEQEEHNHA